VKNHGIREFPHRYQAKYPDYLTQQRYYDKGRLFSIWYESSPKTQSKISNYLDKQLANNVLRYTQLQSKSKLSQFANLPQEVVVDGDGVSVPALYKKNPYVKNALKQQQLQQEQHEQHHQNQS